MNLDWSEMCHKPFKSLYNTFYRYGKVYFISSKNIFGVITKNIHITQFWTIQICLSVLHTWIRKLMNKNCVFTKKKKKTKMFEYKNKHVSPRLCVHVFSFRLLFKSQNLTVPESKTCEPKPNLTCLGTKSFSYCQK